ncbi:hypothetical protein UFOVP53_175 [uncultured Caudovirales phage]|uniref:Uncharacterized protein n=1 Tax=uncultured Caudovirales phage TaxID=2100421 RepID=A0A6J5KWZ2_9CAUD|nr:hypothetical protein UFOVP53_175 [uncultured Caudovirales phage]
MGLIISIALGIILGLLALIGILAVLDNNETDERESRCCSNCDCEKDE